VDAPLFSVGILSGRLPICPSGRAITVTRDGYSVFVLHLAKIIINKIIVAKYIIVPY
jgi:hypothetical protein